MLKKTITYNDYNGNERTEDHYFNLTKAEIAEMELSVNGGFVEMVQSIVAAQDAPSIIKVFKDIILKSYGRKSPDGRQFIKIDENGRKLADEFAQTEAYSQLFMELAFDDVAASKFINGIIPADIDKDKPALPKTM